MKPKGLSELCAATSDLANQTGIEKKQKHLLIIHKPNMTSSHLKNKNTKKTYKWAMETRQRPEIELIRAFMPVLGTSNFDDDSIKNE